MCVSPQTTASRESWQDNTLHTQKANACRHCVRSSGTTQTKQNVSQIMGSSITSKHFLGFLRIVGSRNIDCGRWSGSGKPSKANCMAPRGLPKQRGRWSCSQRKNSKSQPSQICGREQELRRPVTTNKGSQGIQKSRNWPWPMAAPFRRIGIGRPSNASRRRGKATWWTPDTTTTSGNLLL